MQAKRHKYISFWVSNYVVSESDGCLQFAELIREYLMRPSYGVYVVCYYHTLFTLRIEQVRLVCVENQTRVESDLLKEALGANSCNVGISTLSERRCGADAPSLMV